MELPPDVARQAKTAEHLHERPVTDVSGVADKPSMVERELPQMVNPTPVPRDPNANIWREGISGMIGTGLGAAGLFSKGPVAGLAGAAAPYAARGVVAGAQAGARAADRASAGPALDILLSNPEAAADLFGQRSIGGQAVPAVVMQQLLEELLPFMGRRLGQSAGVID
jgi:hypothetical protein